MADWYYAKDGGQVGPVSTDVLRQKIASGEVGAQDMVWRDGMPNWVAANTVGELGGGGGQAGAYAAQAYPAPQQQYPQQQYPQQQYPQQQYPQQPQPGGYGAPGQPVGYGGYAPTGYAGPGGGQDHSGKAIGSLICAICGLLCCGPILGIVAIVLGVLAQNGMKASGNFKGKGMATAGIVIGIIDIPLGIISGLWYQSMQRGGGF